MATLIFLSVMILLGTTALVTGLKNEANPNMKRDEFHTRKAIRKIAFTTSGVVFLIATVFGIFSCTTQVDDGKVGVVQAFGKYENTTLSPGIHLIAPWKGVEEVDTRIESYTFSNDEGNSLSGPISAQAKGGGNLAIELTIQTAPSAATAPQLLREVAGDWLGTITLPAVRSCTRDATFDMTVEEAFSSMRSVIGERVFDCVESKGAELGIVVYDVLIRDVDPGESVRARIDEKQGAEQELQRASIELQQKEIEARQEAVKAFGISQAEQIVACGGVPGKDEAGETIIIPNESCEEQFSAEYLQWLYINQLDQIDGVVILPPEFDGQLFVQTPQPATAE